MLIIIVVVEFGIKSLDILRIKFYSEDQLFNRTQLFYQTHTLLLNKIITQYDKG